MARRGDLAGLAALGALGYMLSKGNKSTAEGGPAVTARPTATPASMESEEDPMEAANKRTERTLIPNQRGEAGTSETVFPSNRVRPAAASAATGVDPRDREAAMSRGRRAPVAMGGSGRGGQGGPTAEELAAYAASRQSASNSRYPDIRGSAADSVNANMRKRIAAGDEGIEGVYPEQMLGGPGLRGAQAIAKGLAARTAGREAAAASPYMKEIGYANPNRLTNNPTKQITGPSKGELVARDRAARSAQRQQAMGEENAARYNLDPSAPGYAEQAANIRNSIGGGEWTLGMKRGGKVKAKPKKMASGGMARSGASKRADGIATKGKTRGRIC